MIRLTLVFLFACGTRDERANQPLPANPPSFGLTNSVGVVDAPLDRVLLLTAVDGQLRQTFVAVGKNIVSSQASADGRFLFVLSGGVQPRKKPSDERPSLSIISDDGLTARYELPVKRDALSIDPKGEYLALYAGSASDALIDNPNEILLVKLNEEPSDSNPTSRTLRSFGGRPKQLTFTDSLLIGTRPRRLLVVETEQDLALMDLSTPAPEVTVRLNTATSAKSLVPTGIIADDGDPQSGDDARIAVKLDNETSILLLDLVPALVSGANENDFSPHINLLDAGGAVTDAAFLPTDAGLRVVALSGRQAVLITPETAVRASVDLPAGYTKLSFLPPYAPNRRNVLLWGAGVALWDLGLANDRPYASIEALSLGATVSSVSDVPNHANLKLLGTSNNTVYVLDLDRRTVSPLSTQAQVQVTISPTGERLWAFKPGATGLSQVVIDTLQPRALFVDRPIDAVYEIGGSLLVAVHKANALGVTVFDAASPDETKAVLYSNLLLGGVL